MKTITILLGVFYKLVHVTIENGLFIEFFSSPFFQKFALVVFVCACFAYVFLRAFHKVIAAAFALIVRSAFVVACLLCLYETILFLHNSPFLEPLLVAFRTALATLADFAINQLDEFEKLAAEHRLNVSYTGRA